MYLDCIFASNADILLNIEKQHDIVVWDSCRLQAYMKRVLLLLNINRTILSFGISR